MADAPSILSILKNIWDLIRGTNKLGKIDNPQFLKGGELRRDFLNNNPNATIINVNGDLYVGDLSCLENKDKEILKSTFSEEKSKLKKEVDIIDNGFYDRIIKFKNNLPESIKISYFLQFLDYDLQNILKLSSYTKKLFDEGDSKEAQRIREDIGFQYGKDGRKLCNLYLSGYIDGMVEYLEASFEGDIEKIKKEASNKIRKFTKESDYIIFIHSQSIEKEVSLNVLRCIHIKCPYIALHGAGNNIPKVKRIIESLKDNITKEGYDIDEENFKTLSLCPLLNIYLTKKK